MLFKRDFLYQNAWKFLRTYSGLNSAKFPCIRSNWSYFCDPTLHPNQYEVRDRGKIYSSFANKRYYTYSTGYIKHVKSLGEIEPFSGRLIKG